MLDVLEFMLAMDLLGEGEYTEEEYDKEIYHGWDNDDDEEECYD